MAKLKVCDIGYARIRVVTRCKHHKGFEETTSPRRGQYIVNQANGRLENARANWQCSEMVIGVREIASVSLIERRAVIEVYQDMEIK